MFGLVFLLLTELCFITRSTGEECRYNGICYILDGPDNPLNSELAESQASVSFSCNYDNITVIHDWDFDFILRTLRVSCNGLNDVTFMRAIDCELDITNSTVILSTSLLGLSAGYQCNLFGCQIKTSHDPPYYTHRIINESCTIPPEVTILEATEKQVVLPGESATFSCTARTNSELRCLEIHWIHNGLGIDMAEAGRNSKYMYSFSIENSHSNSSDLQTAMSIVQIQSTDSGDIGSIICVAVCNYNDLLAESHHLSFLSVLGGVGNFRVEPGFNFTVSLPAPMEAELNLGILYIDENGMSFERISEDIYQNTTEITYIEENAPFSRFRVQFRLVSGNKLSPYTLTSELIDATTQGAIALGPEGFSLGIVKNVINGVTANIAIEGRNIDSVPADDYIVTVGGVNCDVVSVSSTIITCTAPATLPNQDEKATITVMVIGTDIDEALNGTLEYFDFDITTVSIIAGVVPVVSVLLLLATIVFVVYLCHLMRAKKTLHLTQAVNQMPLQ